MNPLPQGSGFFVLAETFAAPANRTGS